jgi:transketolase
VRNAYISALYDLAKVDKQIFSLVADNGAVVYDQFRRDYPERFINFGISEANMVSVAAGLASCGKIPFAYTISNFITMRPFEQVRNDVCLQQMNVKLVGVGAGFVYSNLGPTHHSVEDITLMRCLPDMTIFSPADSLEARKVTYAAAEHVGPVYIRLSTGGSPKIYAQDYDFKIGRAVILKEGKDISIVATGGIIYEVLKAVEKLSDLGISVRLINIHTIKPIDKEALLKAAFETKAILVVEEHTIYGGLGSAVAEVVAEEAGISIRFKRLGLNGVFPSGYGSYDEMKAMNGLSKDDIAREAIALFEGKK